MIFRPRYVLVFDLRGKFTFCVNPRSQEVSFIGTVNVPRPVIVFKWGDATDLGFPVKQFIVKLPPLPVSFAQLGELVLKSSAIRLMFFVETFRAKGLRSFKTVGANGIIFETGARTNY